MPQVLGHITGLDVFRVWAPRWVPGILPIMGDSGVTRRSLLQTAAWSVPVVAVAVAAPTAAASAVYATGPYFALTSGNPVTGVQTLTFTLVNPDDTHTLSDSIFYFSVNSLSTVTVTSSPFATHRYVNGNGVTTIGTDIITLGPGEVQQMVFDVDLQYSDSVAPNVEAALQEAQARDGYRQRTRYTYA